MNYLAPSMFDVSNIDIWKLRMSAYLKTLVLHVYLATTKKIYFGNDKYIEANAQAIDALRHTLCEEHFALIFHCDFTFAV